MGGSLSGDRQSAVSSDETKEARLQAEDHCVCVRATLAEVMPAPLVKIVHGYFCELPTVSREPLQVLALGWTGICFSMHLVSCCGPLAFVAITSEGPVRGTALSFPTAVRVDLDVVNPATVRGVACKSKGELVIAASCDSFHGSLSRFAGRHAVRQATIPHGKLQLPLCGCHHVRALAQPGEWLLCNTSANELLFLRDHKDPRDVPGGGFVCYRRLAHPLDHGQAHPVGHDQAGHWAYPRDAVLDIAAQVLHVADNEGRDAAQFDGPGGRVLAVDAQTGDVLRTVGRIRWPEHIALTSSGLLLAASQTRLAVFAREQRIETLSLGQCASMDATDTRLFIFDHQRQSVVVHQLHHIG